MIVETIKHGACISYIEDSGYKGKTEEEIQKILQDFSGFIVSCLQKRKTA